MDDVFLREMLSNAREEFEKEKKENIVNHENALKDSEELKKQLKSRKISVETRKELKQKLEKNKKKLLICDTLFKSHENIEKMLSEREKGNFD